MRPDHQNLPWVLILLAFMPLEVSVLMGHWFPKQIRLKPRPFDLLKRICYDVWCIVLIKKRIVMSQIWLRIIQIPKGSVT
jgi:hypothetical protein